MMGCCCESNRANQMMSGLNGLMGAMLAKGSRVRVGFAYDIWNPDGDTSPAADDDPVFISNAIRTALLNTGEFDQVSVNVTPQQYLGAIDGYILIQATMRVDKGDPEDFGSLVQWVIQQTLEVIEINRRDPVIIDSVPPAQAGNTDVAQPNAPVDRTPRGSIDQTGPSIWDDISGELNLAKSEAKMLVFGGAALLLILVLKR